MSTHSPRSGKQPSAKSGVAWFAGTNAALANTTISIAKDGRLRYNAGFLHAHKLKAYAGVVLGYDSRGQRILNRFVKSAKGEGVLRLHDHDGGRVANAKTFFTQQGLDVRSCVGRYAPVVAQADGTGPTFAIVLGRKTKTQ